MDLSSTREIFERSGPFATVYLEARPAEEDSDKQVELRWRALKEQLTEAGADDKTIAALDDELGGDRSGSITEFGRVYVASADGLLYSDDVDGDLTSGDAASWSPLPELGAYYRSRGGAVRAVLVVADQTGADLYRIVASNEEGARELGEETVRGGALETVHKPSEGGNAHKKMQRRHEMASYQNAADVVSALRSAVSAFRPEVVVLAGEVQGRHGVHSQLPSEIAAMTREIDAGSRAAGASEDALEDALLTEIGRVATEQETAVREKFQEGKAHATAVEGFEPVLEAARAGAVATLLLVSGTEVPGELYVGSSPEILSTDPANIADMSETKPVARPAEHVLVRAVSSMGGDLAVLGGGAELVDNVGALLRFPTGS